MVDSLARLLWTHLRRLRVRNTGARRHDDANQDEIVRALRRVGATVEVIEQPLDLLVGFRGFNYLLEVKTRTGTLNMGQIDFTANWRGHWDVVRSVDEALQAIGAVAGRT
jgi:hypothetical protein